MRLGSLTIAATLSAALLSGCSFIGGNATPYNNPFAKNNADQQGRYAQSSGQNCQIAAPTQPIPRGCRPEQVTIGVNPHGQGYGAPSYGTNGFPQQPNFGQPQYTNGAYGSALGQTAGLAHHVTGPKKRKPKLRGSLSLGVEEGISGDLIDYGLLGDITPNGAYNPQLFNESFVTGAPSDGSVTTTTYTANTLYSADDFTAFGNNVIYTPNNYEGADSSNISFDDAWSSPKTIKAGLEYILNDRMTVFANGGYTSAKGRTRDAADVTATLYQQVSTQAWAQDLDGAGAPIAGSYSVDGGPEVNTTFIPNQHIASLTYDFSDLEQYDLEAGARYYFSPLVQSEGYKTVTPFVGASVGAAHVNAVDMTVAQRQAFYQASFEGTPTFYDVPTQDNTARVYDAQWLPQGQLNVGAEWQVTPGFALAAETGLKVQAQREYADFTNSAGETISGKKGDAYISIPVSLRGSVNF